MIILFIQNLLGNDSREDLLKNFKTWEIQNTLSGNDQRMPSDLSSESDNPLVKKLLFIGLETSPFFYTLNKEIPLNNPEIPVFFSLQMINMQKNCYIINVKLFLNKINEIFNQSKIHFNSFCQKELNALNKQYFNVSNVENKILINSTNHSRHLFVEPKKENNIYIDYRNLYVKYYKSENHEKNEEIQKLFFDKFLNMIRAGAIVYTENIKNFDSFYWYVLYDQNKSKDQDRLKKFFTLNQGSSSILIEISSYENENFEEELNILQAKNILPYDNQTILSDPSSEVDNPLTEALLFIGLEENPFFYKPNRTMLRNNLNEYNKKWHIFFHSQIIDMQKNCFIINVENFLIQINRIFSTPTDVDFNYICQKELNNLNQKYFNVSSSKTKILINKEDNSIHLFIEFEEENNFYLEYMELYRKYYQPIKQEEIKNVKALFFNIFLKMILENIIIYTQNIQNFESFFYFVLQKNDRLLENGDISKKYFILSEELRPFFQIKSIPAETSGQ